MANRIAKIVSSGQSAGSAQYISGDALGGLTATGSTQATALALYADNNGFTTVAASTGAQLPAASPGDEVFVWNGGANALSVYGQTGENIGAGAANAAFSVAANKGCGFVKLTATLWAPNLSA